MALLPRQFRLDIEDAWTNLSRRPLRSLLSSLGIGIGVTALIAMLSIGEGARQAAFARIGTLGINTLRVEAVAGENGRAVNLSQGLGQEDAARLSRWLGSRGSIGAYVRKDNVAIRVGDRTALATVVGVDSGWFSAERLGITKGRSIDAGDIDYRRNGCVIGSSLAASLKIDVLATVRLDYSPSTVVGIAAPKGRLLTEGTGLSALDFDNTVILPISSTPFAKRSAGRIVLDGLVISLTTAEEGKVLSIAGQVRQLLAQLHRNVDDFAIIAPISLLREVRENQKVFAIIMGAIAGLSLIVGGIGVMNVMLANIAEQTREIGLRMALGASKRRIVSLYLWHAILLTLSGGVWGTLAGVLLALAIQHFAGWEVVFSTFSLILAPFSAIVTGLIFGLHPAWRAASLSPAVALRDS